MSWIDQLRRAVLGYGNFERHADVAVIDPERVGSGKVERFTDLPGGAWRLSAEAHGVDFVIVNGRPVIRNGKLQPNLPGKVLRSGRDTRSVTLA